MSYKHLLPMLGLVLIGVGLIEGGWLLLLVWLGADFLMLGLAHWRHARPGVQPSCLSASTKPYLRRNQTRY